MSNVLPKSTQKEVWAFYRNRFLFVGGIAALLTALVAGLALLPSFIVIKMSSAGNFQEASSFTKEEIEKDRTDISQARALVAELEPVGKSTETFDALLEALSVRPSGVSIQKIQITKQTGEEKKRTMVISGSATNRTKVSEYKSTLSKLSRFESVTVPVGALAGAERGQFSITLSGVF